MPEARHDPVVHRFQPDPEVVARVQRAMMAAEDEASPRLRFVRQRWEEAFGAVRVAMDALREIYPSEACAMTPAAWQRIGQAHDHVTNAYSALDSVSEAVLGDLMHDVLTGAIITHEQLDQQGVPR